jgi:glycosyltransferase involved in cell wall biosynthesis
MVASPFFSVVIPTYNHARFIGRCLESLRRQSFADWHAVVVNNYSQDNTEEIIAEIGDPRIALVNFHNHGVIAASRNEGIRHSRGRYIAFLDSDDEWLPDKLQMVYEAIQCDSSVVLFAHLLWERDTATGKGRVLDPHRPYRFSYSNLLLYGNHLLNSATVVQRSFLCSNKIFLNECPTFVSCEDYDLWLQCAHRGATYVLIDQVLGIYNLSAENESKNYVRQCERVRELVKWHCLDVQTFTRWRRWLYYRAAGTVDLILASRQWRRRQVSAAMLNAVKAFCRNPISCAYYVRYDIRRHRHSVTSPRPPVLSQIP